jgi:bifunctional non-homologous end joining protein LigD
LTDSDLKKYQEKRKFEATPEPPPLLHPQEEHLVFVVHKHAARHLHYDLRLEMAGVLKSWAVPKGPSLDPAQKRLAMQVEDHPFDYKDFEGIIPEGNYGAGNVIIWDRGFYQHPAATNSQENEQLLLEGLQQGNLKFVLAGEKLKGQFALVRTRRDEKSWLLIKKKDSYATTADVLAEKRSVVSHRTLEELSEDDQEDDPRKLTKIRLAEALESDILRDAPLAAMPARLEPMLATLVKEPFDDPDWLFEVKWDGYRAMAAIQGGHVSLTSRNQLSLNHKFAPVVEALQNFHFDALLDGEVAVVDDQGRANFQLLQNYQKTGRGFLIYYVFDLLYFQGHELLNLPLVQRQELLKKVLPGDPHVKFSDHVVKDGKLFFQVVKDKGLEGILAKHSQSVYKPGRRSRQWLKIKTQLSQEGVIAGFTEPQKSRKYFGSLILGAYEGDELVYIGSSGGGFDQDSLRQIYEKLQPLVQNQCPFSVKPPSKTPITWVKPELVCEVAFTEWTGEGQMRHPVFLRLRDDKPARAVVREMPAQI